MPKPRKMNFVDPAVMPKAKHGFSSNWLFRLVEVMGAKARYKTKAGSLNAGSVLKL
jgi:hypothetical protein